MNKLNRRYSEMKENEKKIYKGLMIVASLSWIFYLAGWIVGFMALMSFVDAAFDNGIHGGWWVFFQIFGIWLVCQKRSALTMKCKIKPLHFVT